MVRVAAHEKAGLRQAQADAAASAHRDTRPGFFASRASKRAWNRGREEHTQEARQAAADVGTARESLAALDRRIAALRRAEQMASDAHSREDAVVQNAERTISD